jgi:hypothetical protein
MAPTTIQNYPNRLEEVCRRMNPLPEVISGARIISSPMITLATIDGPLHITAAECATLIDLLRAKVRAAESECATMKRAARAKSRLDGCRIAGTLRAPLRNLRSTPEQLALDFNNDIANR